MLREILYYRNEPFCLNKNFLHEPQNSITLCEQFKTKTESIGLDSAKLHLSRSVFSIQTHAKDQLLKLFYSLDIFICF
jgi:hypothetical protein